MKVGDFLASLDEPTERTLLEQLGAGLHAARMAAQCVSGPRDRHSETTTQLLSYLAVSINHLEQARRTIAERLEQ